MKQKCFSVDSLNRVTFPAKMKEKGTRVVLANGSLMIKSIEIFISHRELECNSVCLELCTLFLVFGGLFIALIQPLGASL